MWEEEFVANSGTSLEISTKILSHGGPIPAKISIQNS
jgi:hypothetical protein